METEKQSTQIKPLYKRRWFKISSAILIVFLLILILLPRGISYGIRKALINSGADQATIENVDFNPFTGALVIDNLAIYKSGQATLRLKQLQARVDWIPFVSKRILVTQLSMDDLNLVSRTLKDGKLRIAGFLLPTASKPNAANKEEKPWGLGLDTIHLTNLHFIHHFPKQDYTLDVRGIDLRNLKSWDPNTPGTIQFNALLNKAPVNLQLSLQPFSDEVRADGKIRIQGLSLDKFAPFLGTTFTSFSGKLNLTQDFHLRFKQGAYVTLDQKGTLNLEGFSLVSTQNAIQQKSLNWDGEAKLQQNLKTHSPAITLTGKLSQTGLTAVLHDQKINLTQASLDWQGKLSSQKDVAASLIMDASVQSSGIMVQKGNVQLLNISRLDIHSLNIKGLDAIRTDKIQITKLVALNENAGQTDKTIPVTRMDQVSLNNVELNKRKDIQLGNVTINNSNTTLSRLQNGKFAVISQLQNDANTKPKTRAPETSADATPAKRIIRIQQIRFTGKNQFTFNDQSVTPGFKRTLDIKKLTLDKLDSSRPNQQSPLVLSGKIGKYASIDLKGYVKPFTPRMGLKLAGKLNQIDLPPLSSYTAKSLGYNLSSGTLNADVDITIENGKIDGKNKLLLYQLKVKPTDSDKIKALTKQLSMPLDAALSLLRDKNNNIELNLPVSGDINDPKFNLSDIINTALGSVLKSAAMSYLSQALQPYGTLITLAKLAKKANNAINLAPVNFTANSSELDSTAKDYLAKIANIMNERPNINIRVCGMATKQDRQTMYTVELERRRQSLLKQNKDPDKVRPVVIKDDTLLALAQKRSDNIKDWLVSQYKISPTRLFTCNPEIDKADKATPRAELGI